MNKHRLLLLLLPLLLTGCGTEHVSERIYTQSLGITGEEALTLYGLAFGEDKGFYSEGATPAEAIRHNEAAQGGRILIGHTELLCLDGSRTQEAVQELLLEQGLSPACKLLYTQVEQCFTQADPAAVLESVRMAEHGGLLAVTDCSTALQEWLGSGKTALLPALSDSGLRMVLLHTDGSCTALSAEAAQGMYWLRKGGNESFPVTVETPQGMEDVTVLRSSLRKSAADGILIYELTVFTDDCPETAKALLHRVILSQCRAAVSEMQKAGADVIGMEELAAFGKLPEGENTVNVVVTVR